MFKASAIKAVADQLAAVSMTIQTAEANILPLPDFRTPQYWMSEEQSLMSEKQSLMSKEQLLMSKEQSLMSKELALIKKGQGLTDEKQVGRQTGVSFASSSFLLTSPLLVKLNSHDLVTRILSLFEISRCQCRNVYEAEELVARRWETWAVYFFSSICCTSHWGF